MMKLGEQTKMDAQEKRKEKNVSHSSHKHHTDTIDQSQNFTFTLQSA